MPRKYDLTMAEFKGQVVATLETIKSDMAEMKDGFKGFKRFCYGEFEKFNKRILKIEARPSLSTNPFKWIINFFK